MQRHSKGDRRRGDRCRGDRCTGTVRETVVGGERGYYGGLGDQRVG